MQKYSFVEESAVDNILAIAGMSTLGSTVGGIAGKHTGYTLSKLKNRNLIADDISWTDPVFTSIVKKDLLNAKNNIKLAREWLDSCDKEDKSRARIDYQNSINEYKLIQKDIADRNAQRWIDEYKKTLAISNSEKFSRAGQLVGGSGAFIGTAAKLFKPKLHK